MVDGMAVRCQSAESQMISHTGYTLPNYQWADLDRLHAKLGVEFPAELTSQRSRNGVR
jgi:hypothetical protein